MTNPGVMTERILQAVQTRVAKITVENGYLNTVQHAHDLKQVLRDEAAQDPSGVRGLLVVIEEDDETYSYRPNSACRASLTYSVRVSCAVDLDAPLADLRRLVRNIKADLWRNHQSDLSLCTAAVDNGLADEQLVAEHRIDSIATEYAFPEGGVTAKVRCVYDFQTDAL